MIVFQNKAHLAIGFLICVALFKAENIPALFFVMVGSILPDIDTPYSKLGKFNPLAWFGLMKHRGFTHTALAMLLVSFFLGFASGDSRIGLGMALGYFSHLLLDSMNPTGIMWAYPFRKRYYRIANIPTGWQK